MGGRGGPILCRRPSRAKILFLAAATRDFRFGHDGCRAQTDMSRAMLQTEKEKHRVGR